MFSLTKRFKSKQWLLALSNDFLKNKKLLYKKYFEAWNNLFNYHFWKLQIKSYITAKFHVSTISGADLK